MLKAFWQKIRKPGWTTEGQKIITDLDSTSFFVVENRDCK